MKIEKLGRIDFKASWDYQIQLFDESVNLKRDVLQAPKKPDNYLLLCEHPHVYTLGKSGNRSNLLIDDVRLKKINATYYNIDRGGDITYHGPGQIVGYPIFDLEQYNIGIKKYVWRIEEVVIKILKYYGIIAGRSEGATGVWLDIEDQAKARKICAIGVKVRRGITMHGFAFNVNTDLNYFNYINPCGFTDKGVTSLEKELGRIIELNEVEDLLVQFFRREFEG
jgi:lipoyl(octanoyl) transferase